MESVNQSYDSFLIRHCELLSTPHYSKDLIVEDMGVFSTPATWERKEKITKAPRKHRSRGGSRKNRSRSSPVRTALSENSSPEGHARSPWVSAKRRVLPDPKELPVPTVLSPHEGRFCDTFLTRHSELLSTQHYSKDLIVEDMGVFSTPATWECKENITRAPRKFRSRGGSRKNRSRSSPVRTALSENSSPEGQAQSPWVSAERRVLPDPKVLPVPTVLSPHDSLFKSQITPGLGISATSYFSPIPPSIPLYIVPLPPDPSTTAAQIEKNINSQHESKVKARFKTGHRIARHLLYSMLKNLPINTEKVDVETVGVKIAVEVKEPDIYPRSNRSIATQALSKYGNNRIFLTEEGDQCSSSESSDDGCEWAGPVRALRNSHVRLVLRQLRHLSDIERLSRALYRSTVPRTCT